jgi:hypothetical protein
MNLSSEALEIWSALGEFFSEVASVDRRWLSLVSSSNNTVVKDREEVASPLGLFATFMGIKAARADQFLHVAGMLKVHLLGALGANRLAWDTLQARYNLDIEVVQVQDKFIASKQIWLLRVGCLSNSNNSTTCNAREQAKRYFVATKSS